jgi:hypothetical protein
MSKAPPYAFPPEVLNKAKKQLAVDLMADLEALKTNYLENLSEFARVLHKHKGAFGFLGLVEMESETKVILEQIKKVDHILKSDSDLNEVAQKWIQSTEKFIKQHIN